MVKLENVTLSFGKNCILKDFSLSIENGEHIGIMGASGSGKTTLLKLISGQLKPTSGTVETDAKIISYMFQEHRLLPWLTAAENVNLVLGDHKETMPEAIKGNAIDKYPAELSGGMRQRVSLARALAFNGDLYLFDEPLASLDEESAAEMISLMKTHTSGKTVVFVTHNTDHAKAFAETIYVLKKKNS